MARRTAGPTPADVPLDLEVLGRADERNPVYAVQLAHAGLAGVLRRAAALGVSDAEVDEVAPEALEAPAAREVVAAVAEAPSVAARALRLRRPDLVARHLTTTAEAASRFLTSCELLPWGEDRPDGGHRARLRVAAAARDSLARGLDLLGVAAPERM